MSSQEIEISYLKELMANLIKSQKETNQKFQDTDKKFQDTDKKFQDTDKKFQDTDKKFQESKRLVDKTSKSIKNLNDKMESFFGNYGEATEEMFYRSLEDKMFLGDIKFDEISRRVKISDNHVEFDIVLINGNSIGIIEVKSKAHPSEIESIIDKKLRHFKIDYPEYSNYKYYFGIASLITNSAIEKQAKKNGIFLLTQKGDHLEVINQEVKVY